MKKQQKIGVALALTFTLAGGLWVANHCAQQVIATQNATLTAAYDQLIEAKQAETKKLEAQLLTQESTAEIHEDTPLQPDLEDVAQSMAEMAEAVETTSVTAPLPVASEEPQSPVVEEMVLPSLGSGTFTVEQLVWWMQSESSASKTAIASLAQAESLAQGVGTEDDADRRGFATTQGLKNFAATMNGLAETATSLGNQYLVADLQYQLTVEELDTYTLVEALIGNRLEEKQTTQIMAEGDTAQVEGDIALLQAALEQCQSQIATLNQQVEVCKLQVEDAKIQLNTAFGNDPTTDVVVTGALVAMDNSLEDSGTLVAQALELRNEVASGYYAIITAENTLTAMRYTYAPDHPTLLEQSAILDEAKAQYLTIRNEIEGEILSRVNGLALTSDILTQLESRLASMSLDAPMVYYPDDLETYGEMLSYATERSSLELEIGQTIAQFNQDMLELEHAVANGTTVAPI